MIKLVKLKSFDSWLSTQTEGLNARDSSEIRADVSDPDLVQESEAFLTYVSNHLFESEKQIHPGETMGYGYWLVKFQRTDQNALETWEYNSDATDFVRGADLTLRYWKDQHDICKLPNAQFVAPRPDELTVISNGVLEGLPVQAVRYPSPDHMSGWWLTTDLYSGNVQTLRHEHTYHVTAARPDLAKYLALPHGFRFDLSGAESVWLDGKVLNQAT